MRVLKAFTWSTTQQLDGQVEPLLTWVAEARRVSQAAGCNSQYVRDHPGDTVRSSSVRRR